MKDRRVTIVVHTDGELESHEYRLPLWAFHVGKWSALTVGLAIVLFFAFAGPIGRAAARAPVLEREVARLREENGRVQQLAGALNRAEASYQELRALLGVKAPPEQAVAANADLMRAVSVRASAPDAPARRETGTSAPFRDAPRGPVARSAHGRLTGELAWRFSPRRDRARRNPRPASRSSGQGCASWATSRPRAW